MKIIKILILILSFVSKIEGQTEAIVTYQFYSYGDFELETTLLIKGDKSWYMHSQDYTKNINGDGIEFHHYPDNIDWFLDLTKNQIIEQRKKHKYPIIYAMGKADMEWDIQEEIQVINGIEVQKAVRKALIETTIEALYYGEVIAWFASEIPFSTGPERYYGLPGLIVKIEYSERANIYCIMKRIEYKDVDQITPKDSGIQVSLDEIVNTYKIDKKWLKQQKKLLDKK